MGGMKQVSMAVVGQNKNDKATKKIVAFMAMLTAGGEM